MKKILFVLTSAALVFTACQKEENENAANNADGMSLTATVEQQVEGTETKSSLSGTTVNWTTGDLIKVFDASGNSAQLQAQSGGTSVSLKETGTRVGEFSESGNHYAIYPYSDATCSGSTITFTLPATQTYVAGSFGQDANVAVASFSGSSAAKFYNVCGVLKLQLKGAYKVSKIEITGNNSEKLNGTYTVDATTYTMTCGTTTDEGEKVITLNCPDEGVQLDPTNATAFYIVVPAGAFGTEGHGGFTAKVYDITGDSFYATVSTTNTENIVNRSKVRAMEEKGVSRIGGSVYREVSFISSEGTAAYINTEYSPKSTSEYTADICLNSVYNNQRIFGSNGFNTVDKKGVGAYLSGGQQWAYWIHNGGSSIGWHGYETFVATLDRTTITLSNTKFEVHNVAGESTLTTTCCITGDGTGNPYLYIFGTNDNGISYPCNMKLYSFLIKENDVPVMYMIPCKKASDDTPGVYDLVNGDFYPNANSSSSSAFTPGTTIE